MKETVGHGGQVQRISSLEKTLLEEQLYSSDLKKKLQSSTKQVTALKGKVKALEQRLHHFEAGERSSLLLLGMEEEDSILERSRSMNDLDQSEEGDKKERQKGGSPPSQYRLPRLNIPKQR